jgi:phosphoribosyl-AMP cyclohydrolase
VKNTVQLEDVRFDRDGLVTVVVQDAENGDVLMVAWANRKALERTLSEGRMTYWSRSREQLWRKGDTSGHTQHWEEILVDCDGDVVLARVHQEGAACHTGERTCFFRTLER